MNVEFFPDTAVLTHLHKSQSDSLTLYPNNSQTSDHIQKVKKAFSTIITKYKQCAHGFN